VMNARQRYLKNPAKSLLTAILSKVPEISPRWWV
jgi:hypothetical protein